MNRRIVILALVSLFLVVAFSPRQGFTQAKDLSFLNTSIKYDLVVSLGEDEATTIKRVLVTDIVTLAGRDFLVVTQSNGLARDIAYIAVESVQLIIPSTSNITYTR